MQIISGIAGGLRLDAPKGTAVRPTPDRAKKGLFDSLGDLSGKAVFDLCAGTGALGLESASRGASKVYFVENSKKHCSFIASNCKKIAGAGVISTLKVIKADTSRPFLYIRHAIPDIIFCDPPYAVSSEYFKKLTSNVEFLKWASNSMLIWELPSEEYEFEDFMCNQSGIKRTFRKFGGINFMLWNSV